MGAVRNFFSGIEGDSHFNVAVKAGAKHVLTSFLYLEKKRDMDIVKKRKTAHPHLHFFIDSGAHTFQIRSNEPPYNKWTIIDYENYLRRYIKWIKKNKEYIFAVAELDIGNVVGDPTVEKWRRIYFEPLEALGIQVVYVWHKSQGLQGWEAMCAKYAYVGLPGEMSAEPDFNKYMMVARRYTTKVHGFAATKQTDFRDWPWFSIDSITWKTGEIYGTLINWDDHKQKLSFHDKHERPKFKQKFQSLGLDADAIIKDTDYKQVTEFCIGQMRRMEIFYEQQYKNRVFYHERRLPHPTAVETVLTDKEVLQLWADFEGNDKFKEHQHPLAKDARVYLTALALVQYQKPIPDGKEKDFLASYFPNLFVGTVDITSLQQEVSNTLAVTNEPAIARTLPEHFETSQGPKKRPEIDYLPSDLEHEVPEIFLDDNFLM